MPLKANVRKFEVPWTVVRRALSADASPKYVRPSKVSSVDMVEPQIRASLTEWPRMPATVIAGPRDHDIRLDSNHYSVHPSAVSRLLEVPPDLQTVTVTLAGKAVGRHERCWARHHSVTDPQHGSSRS